MKFKFLKIYFSPFKPIIPKLYVGKIAIGTPYFFPRRWVDSEKEGYKTAVPKKIGFDLVGLGWKTKWDELDYRFEWNPVWSFVFFKWQIALIFRPKHEDHYWTCWLVYERHTDKNKSTEERIEEAKEKFPCVWISHHKDGTEKKIDYWNLILK